MTNTDSSLEHKERTLQDLFDEATPEQKDLRAIIVAAAIDDVDISGDTELVEGFDALPNEQKDPIDFVVGAALAEDISVQHSDDLKVGAFLAHYGVKGVKWGERKARVVSKAPSKQTVKNVGTELAFGSLGPAAVLAGLGPPVSIAIGLSAAVLAKPAVRQSIARGSKSSAALMKEIGDTKMSTMKLARDKKKAAKKTAVVALDASAEALWLKSLDDRIND